MQHCRKLIEISDREEHVGVEVYWQCSKKFILSQKGGNYESSDSST